LLEGILIPARTNYLDMIVRIAGKHALSLGFPDERVSELELAVEEVTANICMYAYPEAEGDLTVNFHAGSAPVRIVVEIVDSGKPFNILDAPEPDLTSSLEDRRVGGLGTFLALKFADKAEYERSENSNIVRLLFNGTAECHGVG
jgi:serine/threonine-protein kinase RsbW